MLVSGSVAASSSVSETRSDPTSTVLYVEIEADDDEDDDAVGEASAADPDDAVAAVISSACFLGGCRCCVVSGSVNRSTDGKVARSVSSGANDAAHRPSSSGGVEDAADDDGSASEPVAW